MNRKNLKLYFVAIVPEEPVYSEVLAFKTEFRDRFNSSAALRSPPHITLHMPFQWPQEKENKLHFSLDKLAELHQPFKLELSNFGAFPPRVIYMIVNNNHALNSIEKGVGRNASINWHIYQKPGGRAFLPHMTIAFRDLKKANFIDAWQEFELRHYTAEFNVQYLCLLKHNGKSWDIQHRATLSVH